jgi:hypothetical protein
METAEASQDARASGRGLGASGQAGQAGAPDTGSSQKTERPCGLASALWQVGAGDARDSAPLQVARDLLYNPGNVAEPACRLAGNLAQRSR